MHSKLLLFLLLTITTAASAKDFFPEYTDELEVKNIWTQVYFKADTNTAVMNFRVWFDHPPSKVFSVLTDTQSFKTKLDNYHDARTLSKEILQEILAKKPKNPDELRHIIGANTFASDHNRDQGQNWTDYVFYEFIFPWPLADKWALQRQRVDETDADKGEYKLNFKMLLGNLRGSHGSWQIIPVKGRPGWTEFRGRYETEIGLPVPHFIAKKGILSGFYRDIASYRKILSGH